MLWFELDEDCTTSKCAFFCVLEVFCSIVVSFDIPGIFEKTNSNFYRERIPGPSFDNSQNCGLWKW